MKLFEHTPSLPSTVRIVTLIKAALLAALLAAGWHGFWWRQNVNDRGHRADQAYFYLSAPVVHPATKEPLVDKNKQPLSRSQVLDLLIQQALQGPAATPRPPSAGPAPAEER